MPFLRCILDLISGRSVLHNSRQEASLSSKRNLTGSNCDELVAYNICRNIASENEDGNGKMKMEMEVFKLQSPDLRKQKCSCYFGV